MALRNGENPSVLLFWNMTARKRFLFVTLVFSLICGGVELVGTARSALSPLIPSKKTIFSISFSKRNA
jgi:hypothetical protein